jgi:hypothetical protein
MTVVLQTEKPIELDDYETENPPPTMLSDAQADSGKREHCKDHHLLTSID